MTTRPDEVIAPVPKGRCPWTRRRRARAILLLAAILAPSLLHAAPWVVITEIHYHPPEGEALEFVEVLNREPPRLDLTDWRLEGEIEFVFPQDVTLLPGERLVIARDPRALRERYPGLRDVLGPYEGKLDNSGGRLTLRNPAGAIACEVRYDRDGKWPVPPDGGGHTLSIRSPYFDPGAPESWTSSELIGGTPGAPNRPPPERGDLLIREGDEWRYRPGRLPLSPDWNTLEHDDSDWVSGPSGFGYGDGDDATELPDMEDGYSSVFVRKRFDVPDPTRLDELVLLVDYDDGFVAYLNGREVARANMSQPGQPPHGAFADGNHDAGSPAAFPLGTAGELHRDGLLRAGTNLLAVQIHNNQISSSDLTLIVELESRERRAAAAAAVAAQPPRLSEVLLGSAGAPPAADEFIEIHNPSPAALDLGGFYLSDDPMDLKKVELPRTVVEPGGFAVFRSRELGTRFAFRDGEIFLTLASRDGRRVLDALRLEAPAAPEDGPERESGTPIPRGLYPDGSRDVAVLSRLSPGEANTVRATTDLVINEIMYNPITESTDDEFIEIYHRGRESIPLEGYTLRGGIRFDFDGDDRMAPGSYLVIAKDPAALRAKYGLEAAAVVGPYEGQLSNRGETLTLRDREGNVVDRVEFADGAPWPRWADGLGSSLELVHPGLDNALGASWAASDDRGKAEWQTLAYTKPHRYVMSGVQQEFQLMLLADGECFVDDISLGAPENLIPDGDFRRGRDWTGLGTHELSRIERGPAGETEHFHLIADGRGNPRNNYVAIPVRGRLRSGSSYRVGLRAKWQRGSPLLLTRMAGQSLAQLHRLEVPRRLGSPGARNSAYRERPAPAVGMPEQRPITPASREEVTFTVPITSVGAVTSAALRFREEGGRAWRSVPLTPAGDGAAGAAPGRVGAGPDAARLWRGVIPPLPDGRVEFLVEAKDEAGRTGTYPPDALDDRGAPVQPALYAVGIASHPDLPSYTLLVTDREWQALRSRPTLSNRMVTGTLVFSALGNQRIFHGVRLRPRGSPFTRRGERNWRIVFGADTLDGRRSLTLDAQQGEGLAERLTFWLIDALHTASSRQQFVHFSVFGDGESGIYEDVEKVDGDYLDRWFGERDKLSGADAPRAEPRLHKVDDYWELTLHGDRQYQEAFFRFTSTDPEDYRWNFPPRTREVSEDFDPFIELIRFLDPGKTRDQEFFQRAREVIAVDQWIRVLAARALSGDWDTIGGTRGKNAFVYRSPADGLWYLLPWDADLAWGRDYRGLSSRKFPSIARLLDSPLHARLFNGYLEYLVLRKLDGGYFGPILDDLQNGSGKAIQSYAWFANAHRDVVLRRTRRSPQPALEVLDARRIERAGRPDLARLRGVAPVLVRRFLLDGIEGEVELEGADGWTAEFPIGPEGGELKLEALDFGGYLVEVSKVRIDPRSDALPLTESIRPADGERGEVSTVRAAARTDEAAIEPAKSSDGSGGGAEDLPRRREPRRFASIEGAAEPATRRTITTTRSLGERQTLRPERWTPDRNVWTPPVRRERPGRGAAERLSPVLILGVVTSLVTLQLLVIAVRRRRRGRRGVARRKGGRPAQSSWRFDDVERERASQEVSKAEGGSSTKPRADLIAPPSVPQRPIAADRPAPGIAADPPAPGQPIAPPSVPGRLAPPSVPGGSASPPPRIAPPPLSPARRTGRDRLASPVASALRDLASRDFETADRALRFVWTAGRDDIAALIAALIDRRSTPIAEIDMTGDDGVRVIAASGEPGVEVRDIAEILLASAIGEPPVARPRQEDWVAHWVLTRVSHHDGSPDSRPQDGTVRNTGQQ